MELVKHLPKRENLSALGRLGARRIEDVVYDGEVFQSIV